MARVRWGPAKAERRSGCDPATAAAPQVETAHKPSRLGGILLGEPARPGRQRQPQTPAGALQCMPQRRTQDPAPPLSGVRTQTIHV